MRKIPGILIILMGLMSLVPVCPEAYSQQMKDITSEHLLMRLPQERTLLGREVLIDLERFYKFLDGAIDAKLPRQIALLVDWERQESRTNYRDVSIIVGMNQPVASGTRTFLLKESMREIARFGLLELSQGAERPDYEFLYEGMIEILVNEFNHTSRSLESAWVISKFLDEMGQLSLETQRSWPDFSKDHRCFRNAAPGITFLLTFRELEGRDKPGKFFKALRRANLSKSLEETFDKTASELEAIWLRKVRQHRIPDEITISAEEAPQLFETTLIPEAVEPGDQLKVRFQFKKTEGVLLPDGVFIRDLRTNTIFQAHEDSDAISATIPVEAGTAPGEYGYSITAIDESGNLRQYKGNYEVIGIP
jgi:hypothetical protein